MSGVSSAAWGSIGRTGGNEIEGWVRGVMSKMGTLVVVSKL